MSVFDDVRAQAAAIGVRLPPAIGDTEIGIVVRTATARFVEMARRDWAVRVLDAWADIDNGFRPPHAGRDHDPAGKGWVVCIHNMPTESGRRIRFAIFEGDTRDAARLAAAEAVWPELPESVRAELGERP